MSRRQHLRLQNRAVWFNLWPQRVFIICLAVMPCRLLAADNAPPLPTTTISNGHWIKLETYMHDPQNLPTQNSAQITPPISTAATLPSLGGSVIYTEPRDLTPTATHTVTFAAMPPMYEQRHSISLITLPAAKTASAPPIPSIVAVTPPLQPPPVLCPDPKPSAKQAAALADDRATLNALRQAVQDLRLEKDLDFLMPQNAASPQSTPVDPAKATSVPTSP